ncbi:MAG: PHP domain-containing protein [Clostridia bacterium]|nr:PHP domain-containing protein [Clostridia bacterium]MDD4386223.1 PHP domain-containing protein [Clostridia bacterium]
MQKTVKDVFNNIELSNDFLNANVDEVKFSKKLNSVVLEASSNLNISLKDINDFEKKACEIYELKNFKVNYKYFGIIEQLTVENIRDVFNDVNKIVSYTKELFENADININSNLTITLNKPYSKFLKLKRIDEYICKCIQIKFGKSINVKFEDMKGIAQQELVKPKLVEINIVESIPDFNNVQVNTNLSKNEKYLQYSNREPKPKFESNMPSYVIIGKNISSELEDKIVKLNDGYDRACISGEICFKDIRKLKSGKMLVMLDITDLTSTISCKMFLNDNDIEKIGSRLEVGEYVKLMGNPKIDTFSNELTIMINSIVEAEKPEKRKDTSLQKRVELHIHTQMSAMDGISSATSIVNEAIKWGHKAIAITDHGVAQSFPEAHQAISKAFYKEIKEGRTSSC